MSRPSGAAWAALGRDVVHTRTLSHSMSQSGLSSPVMSSANMMLPPGAHSSSSGVFEAARAQAVSANPYSPTAQSPVASMSASTVEHRHNSDHQMGTASSSSAGDGTPSAVGGMTPITASSNILSGAGNMTRSVGASPVPGPMPAPAAPPQAEWKKTLYERQPFEDNYVDKVYFMQQLRTNENLKNLRFSDICRDTLAVVQQLSIMVIFVVVYVMCVQGTMSQQSLFMLDTAIFALALAAQQAAAALAGLYSSDSHGGGAKGDAGSGGGGSSGDNTPSAGDAGGEGASEGYAGEAQGRVGASAQVGQHLKDFFIMTSVLLLLSPIFHTMTKSYSDDTIWALSIALSFVHVIFADYNYLNALAGARYAQNVSMNSAIIVVVLLASRLDTPIVAAALIGFGILCFTLSPMGRHYVKHKSIEAHQAITFMLCGIAIGFLVQLKPFMAGTFVAVVTTLSLVFPYCFVLVQSSQYKVQIQGPWDEAKPRNSAAAAEWANAGLLS